MDAPCGFDSPSAPLHKVCVLFTSRQRPRNVVNSDEQHERLSESPLRRRFRELVSAVEWMHARFVVYCDIKLENILLTANSFVSLPAEDIPLVKLTDFGLSRKIDPDDPWLSTHCGSESYAEQSCTRPRARTPGTYDGRETDASAIRVVLFAI
ncbi:hypothetical protein H4582DRAFT_1882153, partial [Lactarius indigo]